jgi:hypothetical protein
MQYDNLRPSFSSRRAKKYLFLRPQPDKRLGTTWSAAATASLRESCAYAEA